jgi:hypothetical protein
MIKEDKVLVSINSRNTKYYESIGYKINSDIIEVNPTHLTKGSCVKITAICEFCKSENSIGYCKYLHNKNRHGYYSCFKCKNIKKEKTCLEKYGKKSYSMTEEFKKTESEKWKGTRKGNDKYLKTMVDRYGVDCYFKLDVMKKANSEWMSSDEFREKSKKTIIEKWGVESYSQTSEFKEKILNNKDEIIKKIKDRFKENWGVEWISQSNHYKEIMKLNRDEIIMKVKKTCIDRYGVDNVSKVESVAKLINETKRNLNQIIPDELVSEWYLYKRDVVKFTKRSKRELLKNWDGYDYYDNEFIKDYLSLNHTNNLYPTIDHKNSVFWGFVNCIPAEEIGSYDNLCFTKRTINSRKGRLIEKEFNKIFKK